MERGELILLAKEYFDEREICRKIAEEADDSWKESECISEFDLGNEYYLLVTFTYRCMVVEDSKQYSYDTPPEYYISDFDFSLTNQEYLVFDEHGCVEDITGDMLVDESNIKKEIYSLIID